MSYILTNAQILSMAGNGRSFERADSILIEEGLIRALGTLSDCKLAAKSGPEIIDIQGKVVLPAFCDAHTHLVELAKGRFQLKLRDLTSIQAIREAADSYRKANPLLPEWVLGDGWDVNIIDEPQALNRQLLDELFPDKPVALFSKDYHAKWCNTLALKLSGLLKPSASMQHLVRQDSEGVATGIIYEDATLQIEKFYTPANPTLVQTALRNELQELATLGIGSFHSMEGSSAAEALQTAQQNGANFKCVWHFPLDMLDEMIARGVKSYQDQGSFTIGGAKLFADGALGSQTAAMFEPYSNSDGNTGILRHSEAELDEIVSKAAKAGISSTVHAIGDKALYTVIKVLKRHQEPKLLHRIEHLQCIRDQDLAELEDSSIALSVQPVHLVNDIPMIQSYWQDIQHQAYRFKDMVALGNPLAFGSDAPIETINPFAGIFAATQRKLHNNPQAESWMPQQIIEPFDALKAYTLGAAQLSASQHLRGTLEPGKEADICVIDDWRNQPPDFWLKQRSYLTMINGKIIHYKINTY
ncbi:MAG TPA: amidohydrolase [Candidatus Cloacimonadota bacterium]|nr:amidohydrolase [Candidatus Cloacimonadota bacterium]